MTAATTSSLMTNMNTPERNSCSELAAGLRGARAPNTLRFSEAPVHLAGRNRIDQRLVQKKHQNHGRRDEGSACGEEKPSRSNKGEALAAVTLNVLITAPVFERLNPSIEERDKKASQRDQTKRKEGIEHEIAHRRLAR